MTRRRHRMKLKWSCEHDNLGMMTTFRGKTPCVTAATDSMVEVDPPEIPTWVYWPLDAIVTEIISEHDNKSVKELRAIVLDAVKKGFARGEEKRRKEGRL